MRYINKEQFNKIGLVKGAKYTLIDISEFMACTIKREITFIDYREVPEYAQYSDLIAIKFKEKGKRKERGQYLKSETLIFEGWDLLIKTDFETGGFSGNAKINLVGDQHELRLFIGQHNKNPYFDRDIVLVCSMDNIHNGQPLYNEVV